MIAQTFAALSRRASLLTLGTAGAAALAQPVAADAKKNKTKTKIKKKAKKKCEQQVGQCNAAVISVCGNNEECVEEGLFCCGLLATCDATGFFTCDPGASTT